MGVANLLTFSRLAIAPFVVALTFLDMPLIAFGMLLAMVATDIFDGIVARASGTASRRGTILDAGVDYACLTLIISALLYLRSGWLIGSIIILAVFFGIGAIYFLRLAKDATIEGTQLGKPVMSIAVFAAESALVFNWHWPIVLGIAAVLFALNSLLFLKGVYKKGESDVGRVRKQRARHS